MDFAKPGLNECEEVTTFGGVEIVLVGYDANADT